MPAPSGQIPQPWAWWENEAPAARAACSSSQAALAWLPPGEEQVAVQAEEVPPVPSELAEVMSPGVGLVTGEAASVDGVVGHDLAVGDAVGIGVVLGVEEDQTLGLGYRDQWTRQHRFPAAEFVADDQGVTATVAAIVGAGLADYQRAASYLADTWGCITVRAEQQGPGLIRLRGLHRDPLLAPARLDLPGTAPASLTSWWLGWAEDSSPVHIRSAEVSGIVVAGLAGFGKTMLGRPPARPARPLPGRPVRPHRRQGRPRLRPAHAEGVAVRQRQLGPGARCAAAGAPADGRPPRRHRPDPGCDRRLACWAVAILAAGGRDRGRGAHLLPRA